MQGPMWKKQMRRLSDRLDSCKEQRDEAISTSSGLKFKLDVTIIERDAAVSRAEDLKLKLDAVWSSLESVCKKHSEAKKLIATLQMRSEQLSKIEEVLK